MKPEWQKKIDQKRKEDEKRLGYPPGALDTGVYPYSPEELELIFQKIDSLLYDVD